ncbi:MAG TPA: hypothetical protein VM260_20325 [Pirellula sp.]|nr:hypothetical protein [Pirellula sp.]
MKLPEPLKDRLTTVLVGGIAGLLLFVATKIYHDLSGPFLAYILPAMSNKTLLSVGLLGWLLAILLVCWVIYLHRSHRQRTQAETDKAFDDRFLAFDARLGLWTHKTKPGYFCPNCKARHCESPMRERPDGWKCLILECQYVAKNPDYRHPPRSYGTELN